MFFSSCVRLHAQPTACLTFSPERRQEINPVETFLQDAAGNTLSAHKVSRAFYAATLILARRGRVNSYFRLVTCTVPRDDLSNRLFFFRIAPFGCGRDGGTHTRRPTGFDGFSKRTVRTKIIIIIIIITTV